MKSLLWEITFASGIALSIIHYNEIGHIYQAHQSIEENHAPQAVLIGSKYTLLAQADSQLEKKEVASKKEMEVIDTILYLLWKSSLIISLSALSLLGLIILIGLINRRKGTTIVPFKDFIKTSTLSSQEFSKEETESSQNNKFTYGEVIADCLIAELHKIRQKYEQLDWQDNFILSDSIRPQNPHGETCVDASSLRRKILVGSPNLPHLKIGDSELASNIGEVSTSGPISAKISLDHLLLLIKRIWPFDNRNRIISGSIQKYGNSFRIIAHMEQGKHTRTWEVSSKCEGDKVPDLAKDLAYQIAKDLSNLDISDDSFKKLIDLFEQYREFNHEPSEYKLEVIKNSCLDIVRREPTFEGLFGLLYNVGILLLDNKEYQGAEEIFRHTISLEPYIINLVFDNKIVYKDVNWSEDFWRESFKLYQSTRGVFSSFGYPLVSRCRKLILNKKERSEYHRISMWARGLSYTLTALGQTLEGSATQNCREIRPDTVKIKQAQAAYCRANLRDRNDASAYAYLASLLIENIDVFSKHIKRKEGVIEEAQEVLEKALMKKENRCLVLNRFGNLCHDQGDYKSAIDYYEKAIKERHDFIVAYRNLGIIYCEIMDFENSVRIFIQGMGFLPDEAVFQTSFTQSEWHAWLHNGIGWTRLTNYLSTLPSGKFDENAGLLELAEHELLQAIDISEKKCMLPCSI